MGLYLARDDSGNPLLSLTKWPYDPAGHKQWPPVRDKYIDSRLPYIRLVDAAVPTMTKRINSYPSGGGYRYSTEYWCPIPQNILDYVNQGYVVIVGAYDVPVTNDNTNWNILRSATIRFHSFVQPGDTFISFNNTNSAPTDPTGPQSLPNQISVHSLATGYNLYPHYAPPGYLGISALTAGFFHVLNLRFVNNQLVVVSPSSSDIFISRDELRVGTFSFKQPTILTLKRGVRRDVPIGAVGAASGHCIFRNSPWFDSFDWYLGNTYQRDHLLRVMRARDGRAMYELILTQPAIPSMQEINAPNAMGMTLRDPQHPYFD